MRKEESKGLRLQMLVAAVNKEPVQLAEDMRIASDAIIVCQNGFYDYRELEYKGHQIRYFATAERGVGLNRNTSLLRADGDICLFADEDIVYEKDYVQKVLGAFEEHPEADMLVFNVQASEGRVTYHNESFGRVHWYNCGRYPTYSFAAKTEKLHKKNITFSMLFGGGAKYCAGEDSLFIAECIRKGMKVYKVPVCIGWENGRESTWFKGFDRKFFFDRGVLYSHLYGSLAGIMAFRFVFTKRREMCRDIPWQEALRIVKEGIEEGRK